MIIGRISTKDDEMYNTKTKLLKNNQIKDINTNIPETQDFNNNSEFTPNNNSNNPNNNLPSGNRNSLYDFNDNNFGVKNIQLNNNASNNIVNNQPKTNNMYNMNQPNAKYNFPGGGGNNA